MFHLGMLMASYLGPGLSQRIPFLKGAENKMGVMVQRREGTSSGVAGQRRGGVDSLG